jgi:hypothetical protein
MNVVGTAVYIAGGNVWTVFSYVIKQREILKSPLNPHYKE